MPQDPLNVHEEEVSLRDYINVIIKRKKIVLTVFFVSVITSATINFSTPKTYQASSSIMVLPSRIQAAFSPSQVSFGIGKVDVEGERYSQKPAMSLLTHKELLMSDTVFKRVIDALNLTDKSGRTLTPDELRGNLKINGTKKGEETNILELEVTNTNPKEAQEMANAWAKEYIQYNQELISGEIKGTGDFVSSQFETAKQNLFQIEEQIRDFKDKNKIGSKNAELNIKKGKLDDYKRELIDLELNLKSKEDTLAQLKKEIEKQDKFIIVSKAITDDALWQVSSKKKDSSDFAKKKLKSEVINPIYQNLDSRIINAEIDLNTVRPRINYLRKIVALIEEEIKVMEKDISQIEFESVQLNRQAEIYRRTYNNLSSKTEEALIIKQAQLGEVRIVSPAFEPKYPLESNKRLKVAISGIVGLVFGIFLVFFAEYLAKSEITDK